MDGSPARGVGSDAPLAGRSAASKTPAGPRLGRRHHGRFLPALRRGRQRDLRLRPDGSRRFHEPPILPDVPSRRYAGSHRTGRSRRVGRGDGRRHGRRPGRDHALRRLAFAADDRPRGGQRAALRPGTDQTGLAHSAARRDRSDRPGAGQPALPASKPLRRRTTPTDTAYGSRPRDPARPGTRDSGC